MSFAMSIPDWNSLDSVRHAHSELEAAALVFFALLVIFDVLAHLSKDDTTKTLLEKIALSFFAVAVLAELIAYPYGQRNDTLSGQIIVSLDTKAEEASGKAKAAITDSSTALSQAKDALSKAGKAADSLGKAEGEANKAQTASSNALTLARGARQEADSFERDIAGALERAANAEEEAAKLKGRLADRTLSDAQFWAIAAKLKPFTGCEGSYGHY